MNKVTLLGRLVKEVEVYNGASQISKFTLAVNRKFKKDGEPDADFFNIVTFGKTAEFCARYFLKGKQVAVCGRIQNRSWTDKDGNKRFSTDIIADDVYFADGKGEAKAEVQSTTSEFDLGGTSGEDSIPF